MNLWRNFVDSLSSRGGSVLILLVATTVLGVMMMRHSTEMGETATVIRTTFAGFAGSLLTSLTLTLKANGKTPDPTQALPAGAQSTGEIK